MASNMGDLIPVIQFVSGHDARLDNVYKFHTEKIGHEPQYIIQTPGRVNIIGDHIDYHGFSVMPMAIEFSIFMACSLQQNANHEDDSEEKIKLFNTQSDNFPHWSGSIRELQPDLKSDLRWHSFFLCGYVGQLNNNKWAREKQPLDVNKIQGINVAIYSDLPTAAGLSSSSSLVCASAIATRLLLLHNGTESQQGDYSVGCGKMVTNTSIDMRQMAGDCASYERLIGTQGGGMDQAVIVTANEGYAKYVEFMPELNYENVKLPQGLSFLISHCGAEYFKAATSGYNVRVLETKLGAAVIARHAGISSDIIRIDNTITLYRLKQCLGMTSEQLLIYMKKQVFEQKAIFNLTELCDILQFESVDQLLKAFKTSHHIVNEIHNEFKLRSRCVHVIEEALRVETFKSICETTKDIRVLGNIMTRSHESLRDLYECSHPSLDHIVKTALRAGALGSRLTGAGWAGCAITLVEDSKCAQVLDELSGVSKFTIKTEPQAGCKIFKVDQNGSNKS